LAFPAITHKTFAALRMRKRLLLLLLLTLACGGAVLLLFRLGALEGLELKSLDLRFRLLSRPERASPDVVLVAIDDKSLEAFKQNHIVWKWPRDLYAVLTRYLHRGGARVICFDILFPDPDMDRVNSDAEETDGEFAEAMREAGNVILAAHLRDRDDLLVQENPLEHRSRYSIIPENAGARFGQFPAAVLPIPLFQRSAAALGAANYEADPQDGVCRRLPLFFLSRGVVFPHLGMAAYMLSKEAQSAQVLPTGELRVASVDIPLDAKGRLLINWYGRGGPGGCFRYYSIAPLISSAIAEEKGREPILPSSAFRGKIVIVGSSATGLFDFRSTPFTALEPYPAMEIYATVVSNLLRRDFLVRVPSWVPTAAVFLASFLVSLAFFYVKKVRLILLIAGLCGIGWLAAALVLFRSHGLWLDVVAPEVSLLTAFCASAVASYQTEGKARRHLRSVFNRYVSPVVVSEILQQGGEVELGGKEVTVTVFFSDIRDFTAISEKRSPHEVVNMLNDYFSVATEAVLRHEGLVDKYMGDGIMAVFGAPLPNQMHARQACLAALGVQRATRQTRPLGAKPWPELETRIGIHTGPVVTGNIGSRLRMDYTAIGDTVNLASRLEGVNKIFSTRIIISESTFREVQDEFVVRELDVLRVKGKKARVVCYELVGIVGQVDESWTRRVTGFRDGLRWYRERAFDKAMIVFDSLVASFPEDGPSQVYLDRCRSFMKSPPPEDWEGVYQLDTK